MTNINFDLLFVLESSCDWFFVLRDIKNALDWFFSILFPIDSDKMNSSPVRGFIRCAPLPWEQ